jgi:peptidoglycan/LPS O-acetylase OafA/YrhL
MPFDQRPMRFGFLDGLRGWAAVIVLFHHIFVDGLPANAHGRPAVLGQNLFHERHICRLPLLRISGFSLSISYLQTGDERGLARMAAGRYVRLAIPIFAICSITYLLLGLNIIPPSAERPHPLDIFGTFTPSVAGAVLFCPINDCAVRLARRFGAALFGHRRLAQLDALGQSLGQHRPIVH